MFRKIVPLGIVGIVFALCLLALWEISKISSKSVDEKLAYCVADKFEEFVTQNREELNKYEKELVVFIEATEIDGKQIIMNLATRKLLVENLKQKGWKLTNPTITDNGFTSYEGLFILSIHQRGFRVFRGGLHLTTISLR